MTVPSTPRRAGPYQGDGVNTSFPFTFKVFSKSDVAVILTDGNGAASTLILDSDYGIALNADQDANPGGTITYPILVGPAPLPATSTITAIGGLTDDQLSDLTNGGRFLPQMIENALDKLTILIQQLKEVSNRTLQAAVGTTVSLVFPAPSSGKFIRWRSDLLGLENVDAGTDSMVLQGLLADAGDVTHGSSLIGYKLNSTGSVGRTISQKLGETVSVKDFGAVGNGVTDDTVAIQAALNTGRLVYAPAGNYKVTSTLTMSAGGGLYGDGEKTSFIRFFTGGQMIRHPGGNQYKDPIILRDFSITKDASITVANGDTGIDIGYASAWSGRGEITNILILYQWDGFKWKGGSMNQITNVQVHEGKGHGFFGIDARGELTSCLAQYNAGNGYNFFAQTQGETGIQFTSCGTFANQGWGYLFDAAAGVVGANIYMKGVSSSTDGTGGIGFVKLYEQLWMTQILIESSGDANIPFPSFTQHNDAVGLYMVNGCRKLVASDVFVQTSRGGGIYLDGLERSSFNNVTCIDSGRGGLGGANAVGVNFNANCTNVTVAGLICNFGPSQTTDISSSQNSNTVLITDAVFNTFFNGGGNGVRFSNPNFGTAIITAASASTVTLPPYTDVVKITGTTNIDAITASWVGRRVTLIFTASLSVADGNNLILAGAFNATASDTLTLMCDGADWYEVARSAN